MATKNDLILTTAASEAASSSFQSITGIVIDATEPTGTSTAYLFKTDSTWQKYDTSTSKWVDATTQSVTATSVMSEGNTMAAINALPSTAFSAWAGKNVNVAIGRQTTNASQPTINSITVKGETGSTVKVKTVDSTTITLNTESAVEILDIKVDASATNGGSVEVTASIQSQDGSWGEYKNYQSYVTNPPTVAKAIKFKSTLNAPTAGTSTATINSIEIKHRDDNVAVFSEGTGVCITKTYNFVNAIGRAHLMVKHPVVPDTTIEASISLRSAPTYVSGEVVGTGDGTQHTAKLAHTDNLASHGFVLYYDGEVQAPANYSYSSTDGQVTYTAASGVSVTADYIYGWSDETFVKMTHDTQYPDKNDNALVDDQYDYVATAAGDPTGTVGTIKVSLTQQTGSEKNVALGTATGAQQSFKLAHHAKTESIVVSPSSATWKYKDNTDVLLVTGKAGDTLSVSYSWAARTNYLESIACIFNE